MEYVSVLVGEPFTDHPCCTHPVLGELARLVNDGVFGQTRAELATRAPELARYGPPVEAVIPAAQLAGAQVALQVCPWKPGLRWTVRSRRRQLARLHGAAQTASPHLSAAGPASAGWGRRLRRWRRHVHARIVVRDLLLRISFYTYYTPAERDRLLLAVLDQTLDILREHTTPAAAGVQPAQPPNALAGYAGVASGA